MHGRQTSYANRTFNLYSLVYFTGFFERFVDFLQFFAQLKWSGRIYTLMAVSGLMIFILTKIQRKSIEVHST